MRFTVHELTAALTGAAKAVVAAQRKDVRRGKRPIDEVWEGMVRYQRFRVLDALGGQLLPALSALSAGCIAGRAADQPASSPDPARGLPTRAVVGTS